MVKEKEPDLRRRLRRGFGLNDEQTRRWLMAARFGLLGATILLTIGAIMLAAPDVFGRVGLQLLISMPLFIGLYVVSGSTRVVAVGVLLMAVIAVLGILAAVNQELDLLVVDTALRSVVIAVVTGWVSVEVMREKNVSLDTILGGICVYLLLAYFYAHVYLMLEMLDPGSLVTGGHPLDYAVQGLHPFRAIPELIYFSSSTLTTVAYGDITPATSLTRFVSMTEAMLGQLYPTIFIARLVSLNVAQMGSPRGGG